MNIEKNGNKYRITKMVDGVRYRVSVDYKPTKKEAEKLIQERIQSGETKGDIRDTFKKSAEKYIDIKCNVLSPSTIKNYKSIIRNLSDGFLSIKTTNMTQEQIQKEINDYSATHSPKSVQNAHGFISAVLSVYRPTLHLNTTLPLKGKFEPYTPTEKEVKMILDHVAGTEYELPFRLGCYGMRRGEICAISAADLDGNMLTINKSKVLNADNEWVIKNTPKTTGSIRTIYVDNVVVKLLQKRGEAFPEHPNRLNHTLHRITKKLGIPSFRFHDLRAYYCSMAHDLGIPDKYIMASGGWSSNSIMDRVYKRTFADKMTVYNKKVSKRLK